jgi:hypothetical protein
MPSSYIRLDNKFVVTKLGKYIQTDITDYDEWKSMTTKQKQRVTGKDVTKKVKALLKKYGSRSNMNFKTTPTQKKIRSTRKSRKSRKSRKKSRNVKGG